MSSSSWLLALAQDVTGSLPGSNTLTRALEALLERRRAAARRILCDALKAGEVSLARSLNEEEAAAIFYRFDRAAIEGAATLNLKLMARVIAGQAFIGNLIASEFLYYAEKIASLQRDEVILIAKMHAIKTNAPSRMTSVDKQAVLERALIPQLFADAAALRATSMACMRTGLVMDYNTLDDMGNYTTSPLMDRLENLVPFADVLRSEGVDIEEA